MYKTLLINTKLTNSEGCIFSSPLPVVRCLLGGLVDAPMLLVELKKSHRFVSFWLGSTAVVDSRRDKLQRCD